MTKLLSIILSVALTSPAMGATAAGEKAFDFQDPDGGSSFGSIEGGGNFFIGTPAPLFEEALNVDSGIYLQKDGALVRLDDTGEATDERIWDILGDAGDFVIRTLNNAGSATVKAMQFVRGTGTAIATLIFNPDKTDTDFIVKAVGSDNALVVQGSDGKVGINETNVDTQLHLTGGAFSNAATGFRMEGTWPWVHFYDTETDQDGWAQYIDGDVFYLKHIPYAQRNSALSTVGTIALSVNASSILDVTGITEGTSNTLSNDISGNAASATQFASNPSDCPAGQAPNVIAINGDFSGCVDYISEGELGTLAELNTQIGSALVSGNHTTDTFVTNKDSHDHVGGDGAQIDHDNLANVSANDHHTPTVDTFVTNKDSHDHSGGDGATLVEGSLGAGIVTTDKIGGGAVTTAKIHPDTYAVLTAGGGGGGGSSAIVKSTSVFRCDFNNSMGSIPFDDSIPQISEGVELVSVSFTPDSASNRIRVTSSIQGTVDNSGQDFIHAFFVSGTANAFAASSTLISDRTRMYSFGSVAETDSWSGAKTVSVRVGNNNGAQQAVINGTYTSSQFGISSCSGFVIEEVTP